MFSMFSTTTVGQSLQEEYIVVVNHDVEISCLVYVSQRMLQTFFFTQTHHDYHYYQQYYHRDLCMYNTIHKRNQIRILSFVISVNGCL